MDMIRDELTEISRKLVRRYIYEKAKLPCELEFEEDEIYSMIKSGAQEQEWQFQSHWLRLGIQGLPIYYCSDCPTIQWTSNYYGSSGLLIADGDFLIEYSKNPTALLRATKCTEIYCMQELVKKKNNKKREEEELL
uniref:Uncharacterized protein n=1 Tax=Romanomermis culicivorax TaxID=13658 RepID=A0A915IWD3_ROMCU